MTPDELTNALASINELRTEISNTRLAVHDGIAAARKINEATRHGQAKLAALAEQLAPLEASVAAHVNAESVAKAKEASEAAKADAAARANEPQPPSPLEALTAQVAKLAELVAAKG